MKNRYPRSRSIFPLTIKAVVDAVDDVFGGRLLGGESALVLLDDLLLPRGESRDAVHVRDRLVGSVRDDLSGGAGVHARQAKVGADVGVVEVDDGPASEVGDVLVVDPGDGRRGDRRGGADGGGGAEEGATVALGGECGLGRGLRVGGERGGGAVGSGIESMEMGT